MAPKACSRYSIPLIKLVGRTGFETVTSSVECRSGASGPALLSP